jgi:hypothetical protein
LLIWASAVSVYWATQGDEPMAYKFKIGDIVAINPTIGRFRPGGIFEVIKQLPGNGEPEYRIKSADELHERMARESELIKA